ncbi:MAG: hypothetical protein UDS56_11115, partial [Faecalibacterium prausnitzii]|nr:hypothetical protein [Faecalibacterium prausnitzii]
NRPCSGSFASQGKENGTVKSITFPQKSDKLCETVKIWSRFCKKLTFSCRKRKNSCARRRKSTHETN